MSALYESRRLSTCRSVQINRNTTYRSRACVDILPIRFHLYQMYANYNPETRDYDLESADRLFGKTVKLRFSRERASGDAKTTMERFGKYKRVIARSPRDAEKLRNKLGRYLSTAMGLPEDRHPSVIVEVLKRLQHAVPDKIIEVLIIEMIFRETLESSDDSFYRNKLIPAAESFIQALEEASPVDDDELECAICMEMFAQKEDTCSITKLPCAHYYHRDCIVLWLHINHLCPTCRHPNAPSS